VRRFLGGALLCFALLWSPGAAHAATSPPLAGAGTVEGSLAKGSRLTVRLHVTHSQGWQHIQEVDVSLVLGGSTLDSIQFTPTQSSLAILGATAPVSLGQSEQLKGAFFRVNPASVALTARGRELRFTLPVTLSADPPAGARLSFTASATPFATLGPKALTPPVGSNSGFSWGTLGLAIAVALFAGGFVGNLFASRRRPPPRQSVYGAIQRRLTEEKAAK